MKIKRIIAREGLIILGVIMFGISLIYCGNNLKDKYNKFDLLSAKPAEFQNILWDDELNYLTTPNVDLFSPIPMPKDNQKMSWWKCGEMIKIRFPHSYDDMGNYELANKFVAKYPVYKDKVDFNSPSRKQETIHNLRKNIIENMGKTGWLVMFYSYPLYLLIRFIIWSIRTLRKKEDI